VVEVPKAMLGTASTLNVWAETKKTIINYSLLKLKIMTTNKFKIIAVVCAIGAVSCNNDDNNGDAMVSADFQGLLYNKIKWRDHINTVFISGQPKDDFNAAIPSAM
jgi:hypothetical protein